VSVKGRDGHNIALDEWVEMYLVQPLKNYASGLIILQTKYYYNLAIQTWFFSNAAIRTIVCMGPIRYT